ncbi:rhodanese-related sulfurtransferase [Candidatus Pacearchaeota archaeon]|nr:rhodanese-related sulfurtransferase [Candidatus Pacearchaeota archaeon]
MIKIILFYKFVEIENPEELKKSHMDFCKSLGIKGKVLLAKEGINGSISGTEDQIDQYMQELRKDSRFSDIEFKIEEGLIHPFDKMIVRVRKEIIRLGEEIDLKKAGKYVSPQEFLDSYNDKNMVIIDTRNDYESKVGKFKSAIIPPIGTFREFPQFIKGLNLPKDTKIFTYCTGGIRCEKASAYMIKEGFTNVSQLHGGIIKFCQTIPNTDVWEGQCFVFDNRLSSPIGQDKKQINNCIHCNTQSDLYRNCKIKTCNKLIFICNDCRKTMHACCSDVCMKKLLR